MPGTEDNAPTTTSDGGSQANTRSTSNGRSNNNNRSRNNNNNNSVQSTESNNFEGSCPEVGAVAALRTEKITKKVPFAVFAEKVADYVITNYKYGSDVESTIRELTDPFSGFSELYKPTPLTDPNPSFDIRYLQQERIKAFVSRENILKDNCIKIYGLVWRQCTSALQAVIKGLDGYTANSKKHDLIWLLQEIKKTTSGVDVKANPHLVMF